MIAYSVSHYLYSRVHDLNNLKVNDSRIKNVSDADISNKSEKAMVTWNPIFMEVMQTLGYYYLIDNIRSHRYNYNKQNRT